ncbi:MAG: L-threonylcarbamoyladenylate synthase [Bacteroidota bacterium]
MQEAAISMMYDHELEKAIHTLQSGGTILFPTDTIWGVGCDACNASAVEKVYEVKERDRSKPFILLVDSVDMLKQYVHHVHPKIETLIAYHERPMTVIYDRAKNLPANAISEDGSVGIRIPHDDYCRYLIRSFGKPLVATSANISNEPFPNNFTAVSERLKKRVDFIVSHRQQEQQLNDPSVIVKLSKKGDLEFLRE